MTLKEFLDSNNLQIQITFPDRCEQYYVYIDNCYIVENSENLCNIGACGRGDTPEKAINNFLERVRGKTLAHGYGKIYILVPEDVCLQEKQTTIPDGKYSHIWEEINKIKDEISKIKTKS